MKKNARVALLIGLFFTPLPLFASVRISEVMYDAAGSDTGREWIEVVNQGSMPIDLSTYRLAEGGVNHKLVVIHGDALLPSGGAAVIADNPTKFLLDFPNTPGAIFDSTFSLSNTGETIAIKNKDLAIEDAVTYVGGSGSADGRSLSRGESGTPVPTLPTPGVYVPQPQAAPAPVKTETTGATVQLQKQVSSKGGTVARAPTGTKTESSLSVASPDAAQEGDAAPPSRTWILVLGAFGLVLLGVGGAYALSFSGAPKSQKERADDAVQREADTYEIIEG